MQLTKYLWLSCILEIQTSIQVPDSISSRYKRLISWPPLLCISSSYRNHRLSKCGKLGRSVGFRAWCRDASHRFGGCSLELAKAGMHTAWSKEGGLIGSTFGSASRLCGHWSEYSPSPCARGSSPSLHLSFCFSFYQVTFTLSSPQSRRDEVSRYSNDASLCGSRARDFCMSCLKGSFWQQLFCQCFAKYTCRPLRKFQRHTWPLLCMCIVAEIENEHLVRSSIEYT